MEYQNENLNEMTLNQYAMDALRVSAKWSFFLAIMGFIGIGLLLLFALFFIGFSPSMNNFGGYGEFGMGKLMSGIYLIMALIYVFPVYYLYKYASDTKRALAGRHSDMLATALNSLKSHHKSLGISVIVIIGLYIVTIVGMVIYFIANPISMGHM